MRRLLVSGVLAAASLGLSGPASAHHSFAMFDAARTVEVSGVVTEVQWTNPHVWVELDVLDEAGATQSYSFEGGAVAVLKRNGWTSGTLHVGDRIVVSTHPFRDGRAGGSLEEVTFPDGTTLKAGNGLPNALVIGGASE